MRFLAPHSNGLLKLMYVSCCLRELLWGEPTFMKLDYGYGRNHFLVILRGSSVQVGCDSLYLYGCSYNTIQVSAT